MKGIIIASVVFFITAFVFAVKVLSSFSDGAEVARVNSCAAGLSYGMPTKMLLKIYEVITLSSRRKIHFCI